MTTIIGHEPMPTGSLTMSERTSQLVSQLTVLVSLILWQKGELQVTSVLVRVVASVSVAKPLTKGL